MAPDEGLTVCSVWENHDMGVNLRVKCRGFEVVEGLIGSWLVVWQPAVMWLESRGWADYLMASNSGAANCLIGLAQSSFHGSPFSSGELVCAPRSHNPGLF